MSDIVERLRETETDVYTPPELAAECREAADEIERLCSQLAATERGYKSFRDTAEQEFDRLRGLLQWWLDAGPDADWDDYERRVCDVIRNAR